MPEDAEHIALEAMRKIFSEKQLAVTDPEIVEAIISALRDSGLLQEWRPIEEAPKDGTKVFLYRHGWHCAPIARWECVTQCTGDGYLWVLDEDVNLGQMEAWSIGYEEDIEAEIMPTHFMPLPKVEQPD